MNRLSAVLLGALLLCSSAHAQGPAKGKGYTLHEWGVLTAYQDADLANADMRAEWDGLPTFVYGQVAGRSVPRVVGVAKKPVIYFHAAEAVEVKLRVDFPEGGLPAVWWPATSSPSIVGGGRLGGNPPAKPRPQRHLEWQLRLKDPDFPNPGPSQALDDGHWMKALRDVEADAVLAQVAGHPFDLQQEKFVYYDGLLPVGKWADVTATKDRVGVRNRGEQALFDLTAVDIRPDGIVRVARVARLDGGAKVDALEFKDADRAGWPAEAIAALAKQLTAAGLNEDEAKALAKVWQRDLFQTEGVTVFYRLPQAEYDRLLPLTAEPAPTAAVRVGLVVHPHCEPDLAERVAGLVKDLGSAEFEKREQAHARLERLGRAAVVQLARLRDQAADADVKHRLDAIVEKYDARGLVGPDR